MPNEDIRKKIAFRDSSDLEQMRMFRLDSKFKKPVKGISVREENISNNNCHLAPDVLKTREITKAEMSS